MYKRQTYESVPTLTNCTCGGILDIVYDYGYIKSVLSKEKLAARENLSLIHIFIPII